MNSARLTLLLASTGLAALACQRSSLRPVEAPAEQARTSAFPHDKHEGFDCVDCHTGIPKATALGQAKLPGVVKCQECHDFDSMNAADKALHTPPTREARDHALSFNHAQHLTRIKTKEVNDACKTCHKDDQIPEPGPARDSTPRMESCTACHYHQVEVADAKCQPCHVSLRRYPLKPIEALASFSHEGDFVKRHGQLAKNSTETCAQCHDQTYCAKCHDTSTVPFRTEIEFPEKVESDFIHRGDYVSRHQVEAAVDATSCRKCHGSYFCDSCHTAQDTSYRNVIAGGSPHDPHPPGWTTPNSGQFHGNAA
ncbi:MAG TPA: cytochrome c3 family protein, partial [Anaeromyxobacteraceae bacterium]|nr:cytochrome c3 family protein [Anaeromyxobacteraceae bacterium]